MKKKNKSKAKFDKHLKESDEMSYIIGKERTKRNYGDKLYNKDAEQGNRLTFTPKSKL